MNVKISMSVVSVEAIMYLLLYNFHDRTFKINTHFSTYVLKIWVLVLR